MEEVYGRSVMIEGKKIGLCSPCFAVTRGEADKYYVSHGVVYRVFSEIIEDFIIENRIEEEYDIIGDVVLPAFSYMKERDLDSELMLFDMEVLMHDSAVEEIKKVYCLSYIETSFAQVRKQGNMLERALYSEYCNRLEAICNGRWSGLPTT